MVRPERWKAILDERADKIDAELMADIGMALTEADEEMPDVEALKARESELEKELEETKRKHAETINRLIYKGEKPEEAVTETLTETVDEDIDPYEVLYGGDE